ncbi:hypothetical protein [Streptomyces sp. NPDC048224]|uniref:hypothetical protein n=1 Tax=Streptomyces sp. NPDC048224 TaxID=3154500 RepID=UPI0033C209CE
MRDGLMGRPAGGDVVPSGAASAPQWQNVFLAYAYRGAVAEGSTEDAEAEVRRATAVPSARRHRRAGRRAPSSAR